MSVTEMVGPAVLGPEDGKRVVPLPGSPIVFKTWGKRPDGDYDFAEFTLVPGQEGPKTHRHTTHEELFYVLEGELEMLVADRSVVLGPGSAAFVPTGTVHAFRNSGAVQVRFLLVVTPSGLHRYFEQIQQLREAGNLNPSTMTELRLTYDTEEVEAGWAGGNAT